ncbi:hypothetical protein DL95DRAFT_416112 [Leptodontidium sp. 2 PMI_412]|nr:hypothetical protein DL95DRAFT_416112 [Leptodontidium sp. 2 PMI_412]
MSAGMHRLLYLIFFLCMRSIPVKAFEVVMEQFSDWTASGTEWKSIGTTQTCLVAAMENLYWEGLIREVALTIQARQLWQNVGRAPDEEKASRSLPGTAYEVVKAWAPWDIGVVDEEYLWPRVEAHMNSTKDSRIARQIRLSPYSEVGKDQRKRISTGWKRRLDHPKQPLDYCYAPTAGSPSDHHFTSVELAVQIPIRWIRYRILLVVTSGKDVQALGQDEIARLTKDIERLRKRHDKKDDHGGFLHKISLKVAPTGDRSGVWMGYTAKDTPTLRYMRYFHMGKDIIQYFQQEDSCSMGSNVWLAPHETLSIIQLHLTRSQHLYVDLRTGEAMDDAAWIQNRITVLSTLATFLATAGAIMKAYHDLAAHSLNTKNTYSLNDWHPRPACRAGHLMRVHSADNTGSPDGFICLVPICSTEGMRRITMTIS